MIELVLGFPPTVNSYYSHTRNGVFISPKGRHFREVTAAEVLNQLGGAFCPIQHPMYLEIILFMPDRRKRDLDNYMKGLLDSLTQAQVWEDDSLIDQLLIYRGPLTKPKGKTMIRIYPAGPVTSEFPP